MNQAGDYNSKIQVDPRPAGFNTKAENKAIKAAAQRKLRQSIHYKEGAKAPSTSIRLPGAKAVSDVTTKAWDLGGNWNAISKAITGKTLPKVIRKTGL